MKFIERIVSIPLSVHVCPFISRKETIMEDLIKRSDAIKAIDDRRCWLTLASQHGDMGRVLWDEYYIKFEDAIDALMLIPSADRPQGDVDAVDIFEREMHNLEQGYITLGEFDERIEPLRHLCYGRPQGEWIRTGRTNIYGGIEVQCSNCGDKVMVQHLEDEWFCRHCGADMGMKGADDEV